LGGERTFLISILIRFSLLPSRREDLAYISIGFFADVIG
jgi:hypothetical protein